MSGHGATGGQTGRSRGGPWSSPEDAGLSQAAHPAHHDLIQHSHIRIPRCTFRRLGHVGGIGVAYYVCFVDSRGQIERQQRLTTCPFWHTNRLVRCGRQPSGRFLREQLSRRTSIGHDVQGRKHAIFVPCVGEPKVVLFLGERVRPDHQRLTRLAGSSFTCKSKAPGVQREIKFPEARVRASSSPSVGSNLVRWRV
ncbi:hypothetical protein BD310DRAFT_498034 [Dichomitus squalens]|uniref:Uncharacterized protein n=1 Tax=Dichomitus squalens TaxID=114155 RepID=A0A4Q9PUM8_9APHY|nr:hypothetical protein BD310DRAFT_498034 [Dichomitus squalens]